MKPTRIPRASSLPCLTHLLPLAGVLLASAPALWADGGDDGSGGKTGAETTVITDAGERWGAGYFPNVPLLSHKGTTEHFFDLIEGKVVVINFIYTSCPDACPLETAKLVDIARILGDRVGQDVFFYSISIDPEVDSPEVLAEYAERFQIGPGWLFLTGDPEDIMLLRRKTAMFRENEPDLSDHSLNLLIGNQATGQWMMRSSFENSYLLAAQIGNQLHNWKNAPEPGREYANAPELRLINRGEDLFRTRCSTCHGFGNDGIVRQGPELTGVTERRERAWLARWLAEPDKMLAEGDPIAVELYKSNRYLPMPNMHLQQVEIDALLEYIDSESRRVQEERRRDFEDWAAEDTPAVSDEAFETGLESEPASCCQKLENGLIVHPEPGTAEETPARPSPVVALIQPRGLNLPPLPSTAARGAGSRVSSQEGRPVHGAAPRVASAPGARAGGERGGVALALGASTILCLGLALALGILSFGAYRLPGRDA